MPTNTNILATEFKSITDIDNYFKQLDSLGFVDWYNKNHAGKNNFNGYASIKNTGDFAKYWSNIKSFYNKDSVNLVEFLSLTTITIIETGSAFKPITEKVGNPSNPGISYAYNSVAGLKSSYNNNNSLGNISAYDLFNNSDYVLAHSHKPFGDKLKNTKDLRWNSTQFPLGFSGSPDRETSTNVAENTFLAEADFNKFRGRGFIQTTGRDAYLKLIEYIVTYSGQNSKLVSYKSKWTNYGQNYNLIATISTNFDWDDIFKNTDFILPAAAVYIHQSAKGNYLIIDPNQNESNLNKSIRNIGKKVNGGDSYADKYLLKVKQLINSLNATVPAETTTDQQISTATQSSVENTTQPIVEQPRDNDNSEFNSNPNQGDIPKVEGLTNFFKPTINIELIDFKLQSKNKLRTDEIIDTLGYLPFVWYNGVQLEPSFVSTLQLSSTGLLPTVKLTFTDQYGNFQFEDNGFPLDDAKIKIFIASRSKSLRPILMDFKITKFRKMADDIYSIEGICDVNFFFVKRFESYSNKTSFLALQDVAKKSSLGFNSNIDNTNDQMTWISPGYSGTQFVEHVINKAYKGDESFLWAYVDFYYNLNYVDIEAAFNTDIKGIGNVQNMGLQAIAKLGIENKEDVNKMILSNDKSMSSLNNYFNTYKITNKSTDISIRNGYLNVVKYYDINNFEYSEFDVDSITSQGDKTIILKGSPQDNTFFNENINPSYLGKIDQTNMHRNYNYAQIQNKQNIEDIQKIGVEITIPVPNFNLYRFQKVFLLFNEDTPSLTSTDINNRLSGEWLILNIKFVQNLDSFIQIVSLVKRELDLSKKEFESEGAPNKSTNTADNSGPTTEERTQDTGQEEVTNETPPPLETPTNGEPFVLEFTTEFSNSSQINDYFKKMGYLNFVDWFNKTQGFKDAFAKKGNESDLSITNASAWEKTWNNISFIYGKSTCNLIEFLTMNTAILAKTSGKFTSTVESSNSVSDSTNPGISNIFFTYNSSSMNQTAYDLFNDTDYKDAHGHKPYGNELKDTQDQRWETEDFPIGFSGVNNIKKEVSPNVSENGFITEADFFKFRGRGYIQIFGRLTYKKMVEYILSYSGDNSKINDYKQKWSSYNNNTEKILTISTNADWDDLFNNTNLIVPAQSVFIDATNRSNYQIIDGSQKEDTMKKSVRNVGMKISGNNKSYTDLYEARVYQQIDWLQKNSTKSTT